MPHDLSLKDESAPVGSGSRESKTVPVEHRLQNIKVGEPAFRRQFSCRGWPLMARIIWWALRNDR